MPGFRLFAADGFVGEIGGSGSIFGTNGFQDIGLLGQPGSISFDASFNRGGDIARFPGIAGSFSIYQLGSSAVLTDADAAYTLPVGAAGTQLVFDDGVRTLVYDADAASLTIGGQAFSSTPTPVTAPTDGSPLPTGADPSAIARLFLSEGARVAVGGNYQVFGTAGAEQVTFHYGNLTLDPSFNRGGDTLFLSGLASAFTAYLSGSTIVLLPAEGTVNIPVGTAGMILDFLGDARELLFDAETGSVRIGNRVIDGTSAQTAVSLEDAPDVPGSQNVSTDEDTTVDVVIDATDLDGDMLFYSVTVDPGHGMVTGGADGLFVYTPDADYNGPDSFEVTVGDGHGGTATQTVNVTVLPVNDAPTAPAMQVLSGPEDTIIAGSMNASDVDGDTLTYGVSDFPDHGMLAGAQDGSFTYTPDPNYVGSDSFVLTVSDGHGGSANQTVTINIGAANDVPVFVAGSSQSASTDEDTPVEVDTGATDQDEDPLTYSVMTAPAHGQVSGGTDGVFTYTPDEDFNGPDSFVVSVSDGQGGSATQTVNITVDPVNDAPTVASEQLVGGAEDTEIPVTVSGMDVDGEELTYSVTTEPSDGEVTEGEGEGEFIYTPDENYNGFDHFVVTVSDGEGGTAQQTVNVLIGAVNDAPFILPGTTDDLEVALNGSAMFVILAEDPDGDALTVEVSDGPDHGAINNNTYTADANYIGPDTFVVAVSDGKATTEHTVSVTVAIPATFSIDIVGPNSTQPKDLDASAGGFTFTDDATEDTDVRISGFTGDDVIQVTGASSSDYNFSNTIDDPNDLFISFTNTSSNNETNIIVLDNVLSASDAVYDYASAVDAVGFNFIVFG